MHCAFGSVLCMGLARTVSVFFIGKSISTIYDNTTSPHIGYDQGWLSLLLVAVSDLICNLCLVPSSNEGIWLDYIRLLLYSMGLDLSCGLCSSTAAWSRAFTRELHGLVCHSSSLLRHIQSQWSESSWFEINEHCRGWKKLAKVSFGVSDTAHCLRQSIEEWFWSWGLRQ